MDTYKFLERAGLRPTLPRVMVLAFFQQHAHDHFSAEQVYKLLNEGERTMSLATVYRVLAQLVDVRLLTGVVFGDGRTVYELDDGKPHDHVVCTGCGAIAEFFDPQIEARERTLAETLGFLVAERQLVLSGLCTECRKTSTAARAVRRR